MKKNNWIPVTERLPEEGEYVFVLVGGGSPQVARLSKGISMAEREQMIRGEIPDPVEYGWNYRDGVTFTKRSRVIKSCDEDGNNLVPYRWFANGGLMQWFGQDVTHWMPIPELEGENNGR